MLVRVVEVADPVDQAVFEVRGGSGNLNRGIGGIAAWMAHDGASGFTGAIDDQTSPP
jgi:hypothetical protein